MSVSIIYCLFVGHIYGVGLTVPVDECSGEAARKSVSVFARV